MEVKEGLEALQAEDMIPKDVYKLRIRRIKEARPPEGTNPEEFESTYSIAECELLKARDAANNDPKILGRRVDYWLIGDPKYGGRRGLMSLLLHKHLYDPEGGWVHGIPEDEMGRRLTTNLTGTEFNATVQPYQKKDSTEWGYAVYPITLPDQQPV